MALLFAAAAASPRAAGAAPMQAGLAQLAPAGAYAMLSPAAIPQVVREAMQLAVLGGPLFAYRLKRQMRFAKAALGFDPLQKGGIAAIGLDPDAPIFVSIAGTERGATGAIRARYRALRAWLLRKRKGKRPRSKRVTLVHHRAVAKLKSEARLLAFARKRLGLRPISGATAPATAKRIGLRARDLTRLSVRRGAKVIGVTRAGERLMLLSISRGFVLLDVVEMVGARRTIKAALLARLVRVLRQRAPAQRGKLARKAFAPGASAALLLRASKLLDIGLELGRLRGLDAIAGVSRSSLSGMFSALDRELGRCSRYVAGVRRISKGAALRLTISAQTVHAAAFWDITRPVARLLRRAAVKQPLMDPTAHKAVLGLLGSRVALGRVGRALARAPFDTRLAPLARSLSQCGTVGVGMLALGGWLGAVGALYREARAEIGPAVEQVENAIGMLVSLPHTVRYRYFRRKWPASAVVQAIVGGRSAIAVERQLARAARTHRTRTFGGVKATVHSGIRRFSHGAIAVSPLGKGRTRVTIGWRASDVRRFLSAAPPKRSALPAAILAYGHVFVPKLLRAIAKQNARAKALLLKLAGHLGRLGGNIALDGGMLNAELRMNLKP